MRFPLSLTFALASSLVHAQSLEWTGIDRTQGILSADGRVVVSNSEALDQQGLRYVDGQTSEYPADRPLTGLDGDGSRAIWSGEFEGILFGLLTYPLFQGGVYDFDLDSSITFSGSSCEIADYGPWGPTFIYARYYTRPADISRDGQFIAVNIEHDSCFDRGGLWSIDAQLGLTSLTGQLGRKVFAFSGNGNRLVSAVVPTNELAVIGVAGPGAPYAIAMGQSAGAFEVLRLDTTGDRALVRQYTFGSEPPTFLWIQGSHIELGIPATKMTDDTSLAFSPDECWDGVTEEILAFSVWLEEQGVSVSQQDGSGAVFLDVDAAGRVILGQGFNPSTNTDELFLAHLPAWRRYGLAAGGANDLRLDASGSSGLGEVLNLEVKQATGAFVAVVTSLEPAAKSLLGGLAYVETLSLLPTLVAVTDANGEASLPILIPSDPAFDGLQLYAQAASPDVSRAQGWGLSNGLRVTFGD